MLAQLAVTLVSLLQKKGVRFEPGLTDAEVERVAATFGVVFPPDLRLFLQAGLPVSDRFPNWRKGLVGPHAAKELRHFLDGPLKGLLFDVEHNAFWPKAWGEKPSSAKARGGAVRRHYAAYPQLVPIYGHRYLPAAPNEAGNPVFSVQQADIVLYGKNLPAYLAAEFQLALPEPLAVPAIPRKIVFWSEQAGL